MKLKLFAFLIGVITLCSFCNGHGGAHHNHAHQDEEHKPSYVKLFERYFQNDFLKISISILVVSLPSLPVFLLLNAITKFFCSSKNTNHSL